MFNCHCSVCLSDFPVEDFRRLACGHCYCLTCTNEVQRMPRLRAVCPQCRAPIAEGDARPIYLNIVASRPLESVVADGIRRMDHESPEISVKKAERKLRHVAEQPHLHQKEVAALLAAIEDFNKRIIPIFARAKSQHAQIAILKREQKKMSQLEAQAELVTTLGGEVAILRAEIQDLKKGLHKANVERDLALELADQGKVQVLDLRGQLETAHAAAQNEIRRLKGLLERNSEDRTTQKHKIQALQQEIDRLVRQVDEGRAENREKRIATSSCTEGDSDLEIEEDIFPSKYPPATISSQPTNAPRILPFEGMPRPGFESNWHLAHGTKRKERDEPSRDQFPIALSHGRTTTLVQLGPIRTRRVRNG